MVKKFGKAIRKCRRCGRTGGVIRKYGLYYCRQRFLGICLESLIALEK